MSILIQNYCDVIGKPNTVCTFDVYFPAWQMTIHTMKLMRSKKGGLFLVYPARCEKQEDGTFKFYPYLSFSKDRDADFQKKVLELLKEFTRIE